MDVVSKIGTGVGRVISVIYQAARDTVNDVIRNIIPFMAFVSVLIGITLLTTRVSRTFSPAFSLRLRARCPVCWQLACSAQSRSFRL